MNTTTNSTDNQPTKTQLGVVDKLNLIISAWENLAPEAKFSEMTLTDFRIATSGTTESRRLLEINRVAISSHVSVRIAQEAALCATLKRVAAAVVVDGKYGPDSALYRAMGYVRPSERKSPSGSAASAPAAGDGSNPAAATSAPAASTAAPAAAKTRRKPLLDRYHDMVAAWEDSQEVNIGGLTIEDWKSAGEKLASIKRSLSEDRTERRALVATKITSDRKTRALIRKVVASVVASPAYGENSALYRAMGYIPMNER